MAKERLRADIMDPRTPTFQLRQNGGAHCLVNCHVFAKPEHIAELERQLADQRNAAMTLHAIAGHEPLPLTTIKQAQCIVLEVDPRDRSSLARMEQVRASRPSIPIIAAIENADFNLTRVLIRQGVFDVLSLPFDADEVLSRIMDASATVAARSSVQLAPMVAIVGANASIGATTVLTHLAAALSHNGKFTGRCCIVDLDLQFGQVASYFGVEPSSSVLDLLEAGERLDSELVRNAATDTGRGPIILAAPPTISPFEDVEVDRLLRLLEIVRKEFDFVLLDLPTNWTNWTLSAVAAASGVFLVTDQSIRSLRQAKRCLELFESVDIPANAISILVNSFEKRLMQRIGLNEVEAALNRPVRATFAREKNGLSEAQDQGLLLPQVARKAPFSRDIAALADEISAEGSVAR
jgi:pilus assembly protein CpaE